MEKIIPTVVSTLILSITCIYANAQKASNLIKPNEFKNDIAYVSVCKESPATMNTRSIINRINIKAVRHFMKTYPNILDEEWQVLKDGYKVSFDRNSKMTTIYYDKKGNWSNSIDQYEETELLKEVRAIVRREYYDYAITTVQEVCVNKIDDEPIYIIHLKYNSTFKYDSMHKTVKLYKGEMQEIDL